MAGLDLETKAFGALEIKHAEQGEVVAVVATLGVVDRDSDVILPGAIPHGGAKVRLSGYAHDVVLGDQPPAGKGVIYERDGKAVFEGKFFMSTERGREAFHTTKELGADGQWSFGFPGNVKTAELTEEWRIKGAKRLIAGLIPIEASPVFLGAGIGTGTVSVKQPGEAAGASKAERAEMLAAIARALALCDTLLEPNGPVALDIARKSVRWLTEGRRQDAPAIRFFDPDGRRNGFFDPRQPEFIHLARGLSLDDLARVVGHECAHYLAPHSADEHEPRRAGDYVQRRYREALEAGAEPG
jgi:hypothetical protein